MSEIRDFNPEWDDNKKENKIYSRDTNNPKIKIVEEFIADDKFIKEKKIECNFDKEIELYSSPQGQSKIVAWLCRDEDSDKGKINALYLSKRKGKKQIAKEKFTLTIDVLYKLVDFLMKSEEISFLKEKENFYSESAVKDLFKNSKNIELLIKELERLQLNNVDNKIFEKIKNISTSKELLNMKNELQNAIDTNMSEPNIEEIFKKYQGLLSILIPSIDSVKKFQFYIDVEGHDQNIGDIFSFREGELPNLIELKRPDMDLLNKSRKYRNNTYKPTVEFSGAIQQANIQRVMYATEAKIPKNVLVKSVLIAGHKANEFTGHKDEDSLYFNLDTIKYNNKDLEIITYDELIGRIDKLINTLKIRSSQKVEETFNEDELPF